MKKPMKVMLTGGTGFLGEYLLAELLEKGHQVWALYRGEDKKFNTIRFLGSLGLPRSADSLHWFKGDLLKLDEQWGDLCALNPGLEQVDTLLQNAASTRFHLDRFGEPWRTNLGSVQALSRLLERHPMQVHLISTAYVCGFLEGTNKIMEVNHPPGDFINVYEESKWEAEQLWQEKATILRPSAIVGHSETGRCKAFTGWYVLFQAVTADWLLRDSQDANRFNLDIKLPADPDGTINIIPVDYVAKAAVAIIEEPENHNKIFHLTHPNPPRHEWTRDYICRHYNIGGLQLTGSSSHIPAPRNQLERLVWGEIRQILYYFSSTPIFDRTNTDKAIPHLKVPPISEDLVTRLVEYAIAVNWGQGKV